MTTLVWNLEENATRRHLLAEALLQLPEERRAPKRPACPTGIITTLAR